MGSSASFLSVLDAAATVSAIAASTVTVTAVYSRTPTSRPSPAPEASAISLLSNGDGSKASSVDFFVVFFAVSCFGVVALVALVVRSHRKTTTTSTAIANEVSTADNVGRHAPTSVGKGKGNGLESGATTIGSNDERTFELELPSLSLSKGGSHLRASL